MSDYKLVRLVRTAYSEVYLLWDDDVRVGQVDLHYAEGLVHGTIIVEQQLSREQIEALISQLDEDVVSSYLPDFEREDFFVNVYAGEEILSFSDTDDDDDEES